MKQFFSILLFITSFQAFGAAQQSILPLEVRDEIQREIYQTHPDLYDLREIQSSVSARHVDQQIYDLVYTTQMTGKYRVNPQTRKASLTVVTVDASASISNPNFKAIYVESLYRTQLQTLAQRPMCLVTGQTCQSYTDICCNDGTFCGTAMMCR